jgi:hypothetical protein
MKQPLIAILTIAMCSSAMCSSAFAEVRLLPVTVKLTGPQAQHRMLVERIDDHQLTGPAQGEIRYSSDDSNVVRFEDGTLIPVSNGTTTVHVATDEGKASAKITVENIDQP